MGLSTTYTKTETDYLLQKLESELVSGLKGTLTISDTAPTAQGLYILSDIGTYTNLGGIVTTIGKINYAYFNGTTWELIVVDIPNFVAPIDSLESSSTTAPLSANQGRILNDKLIKDVDGGFASFELVSKAVDWEKSGSANGGNKAIDIATSILKAGRKIQYKIVGNTDSVSVFLFRQDDSFINIGSASTSYSSEYILEEDFVKIKFYNNSNTSDYEGFLKVINVYTDEIKENANQIKDIENSLEITTYNYISNSNVVDKIETFLKKGRTIRVKHSGNSANIDVYLYRADDTYIYALTSVENVFTEYILEEDFVKIKFYNNSNSLGFTGVLELMPIFYFPSLPNLRILILGDSYSAGNENPSNWVREMMRKLPIDSTFYSLAVGGATVRDKYSDLTTYPYTSRPISSDNSGNNNTLGSQIQKLKRLMNGTDLDSGESKLYENPSDYPNVIIIQGGMNDGYDNDDSTYTEQFTKEVNNVYIKLSSEGTPYLGSAFVKTPISEVNRTIYAGAYRYLAEELLTLFPNAQIFIVTASRLGYWMTDVNNVRNKTAEQQRISARLLGASIIDWNAEGNVNTIQNYVKGSGTTDDPYVLDRTALNKDTDDAMHPNDSGGVKYGRLAAKVINERFINFLNEL